MQRETAPRLSNMLAGLVGDELEDGLRALYRRMVPTPLRTRMWELRRRVSLEIGGIVGPDSRVYLVTEMGQEVNFFVPSPKVCRETVEMGGEALMIERMREAVGERIRRSGGVCFVDIGAAFGGWAVRAGRAGASVVCLEPDSERRKVLVKNLRLNGLVDRSLVLGVAAVADTGRQKVFLNTDGIEGKAPSLARGGEYGRRTAVPATTLDKLCGQGVFGQMAPLILKIDVEGGEAAVLQGAGKLLRSGRITDVFLEVHPLRLTEFCSSAGEVERLMVEAGYGCGDNRLYRGNEVILHFQRLNTVAY